MEQEKNPKNPTTENGKHQQHKQDQKPKRERKTIEQELAELEAKKQKILNKKRQEENHAKIVFGAVVISILKKLKAQNDEANLNGFCGVILENSEELKEKDREIINNIITNILSPEAFKNLEKAIQEKKNKI